MTVKQISVFVENKAGQLAEFTKLLRHNSIDMRALSIAETLDFGILRVIVDDSYKTACVLKEAGYIFSITPVLAVAIKDETGGLDQILNILAEHNINLDYTYAFISRKKDTAYMIFRVDDNEKAKEVLVKNSIKPVCQDELYKL